MITIPAFGVDTTSDTDQIGTVELIRVRVYTIDPDDDVTSLAVDTAIVGPGTYPLYRSADVYWWTLTGNGNRRGIETVIPGTFVVHASDEAIPEMDVTFPSRRFPAAEFVELLLHEPILREDDPQQALRFHFAPGTDPRTSDKTKR